MIFRDCRFLLFVAIGNFLAKAGLMQCSLKEHLESRVFLLLRFGVHFHSLNPTPFCEMCGATAGDHWNTRPSRCIALARKPRATPGRKIKITGEVQAHITQLACTKPPAGHARWTLKLLASHLVEIEVIESISHQSVGTVLKKVNLNHGGRNAGASHPNKTPPS